MLWLLSCMASDLVHKTIKFFLFLLKRNPCVITFLILFFIPLTLQSRLQKKTSLSRTQQSNCFLVFCNIYSVLQVNWVVSFAREYKTFARPLLVHKQMKVKLAHQKKERPTRLTYLSADKRSFTTIKGPYIKERFKILSWPSISPRPGENQSAFPSNSIKTQFLYMYKNIYIKNCIIIQTCINNIKIQKISLTEIFQWIDSPFFYTLVQFLYLSNPLKMTLSKMWQKIVFLKASGIWYQLPLQNIRVSYSICWID